LVAVKASAPAGELASPAGVIRRISRLLALHKPTRRPRALALVAVALFVASGCGSGKPAASTTSPPASAKVAAGQLGISGADVDESFRLVAKQLGRTVPKHGVAVESFVNHPPAESAGLKDASADRNAVQDSDIIETVDGQPATAKQLEGPLPGHRAGDTVTLHVWSAHGAPHDLSVRLAAVPTAPPGDGSYFPGG
jgi:hypothetical protein